MSSSAKPTIVKCLYMEVFCVVLSPLGATMCLRYAGDFIVSAEDNGFHCFSFERPVARDLNVGRSHSMQPLCTTVLVCVADTDSVGAVWRDQEGMR